MAGFKLTDLTEITTPALTDLLYLLADPAGTPADRKVTRGNLLGTDLLDLQTRWTPASSSGPASLVFPEDTDNGAHTGTLIAPSSLAADRTWTLPSSTGTVALTSDITTGLKSVTTVRKTDGNIALQTATVAWANTSTALDLTAAAVVGDRARVSMSGLCDNEARDSFIDAVTLVGGSPVNSFANQGAVTSGPPFYGIPSWRGNTSTFVNLSGSADLVLASGDLSGGNVTIRFRSCTSSNGAKTLQANTNYALTVRLEIWAI